MHNEVSSRSHAILQVSLEMKDKVTGIDTQITLGNFTLVDLAGSERGSSYKNTGPRLIESGNINKSLLALANCINILVDSSTKGTKAFIPWRDSKLTRILKVTFYLSMDSLGGNSRIVMIANISPSILNIDETINTLKYANRAKNIKIMIKKNVLESEDYHISKYDDVVTALRSEIEELKLQLSKKNNDQFTTKEQNEPADQELLEKTEKIQKDITNHFQEEIKIRKEIIEIERKIENNKVEAAEKEYDMYKSNNDKEIEACKKKIASLNAENDKLQTNVNEMYIKQSSLINKRTEFQKLITLNTKENPTGSKILMNTYLYFSSLLDNMNLEHRRNVNFNEIRRKDFQINKLADQIRARDDFILQANSEIKKNKIPFKFNNENLKSIEEIDLEPLKLPVIIHKNNFIAKKEITQQREKSPTPKHSKNIKIYNFNF